MGHYVYKCVDMDTNDIIYIGKTNSSLVNRIYQHKVRKKFINIQNIKVYYIQVGNKFECNSLEKLLISKYKPKFNKADKFDNINIFIKEPEWIEYNKLDFVEKSIENDLINYKYSTRFFYYALGLSYRYFYKQHEMIHYSNKIKLCFISIKIVRYTLQYKNNFIKSDTKYLLELNQDIKDLAYVVLNNYFDCSIVGDIKNINDVMYIELSEDEYNIIESECNDTINFNKELIRLYSKDCEYIYSYIDLYTEIIDEINSVTNGTEIEKYYVILNSIEKEKGIKDDKFTEDLSLLESTMLIDNYDVVYASSSV